MSAATDSSNASFVVVHVVNSVVSVHESREQADASATALGRPAHWVMLGSKGAASGKWVLVEIGKQRRRPKGDGSSKPR